MRCLSFKRCFFSLLILWLLPLTASQALAPQAEADQDFQISTPQEQIEESWQALTQALSENDYAAAASVIDRLELLRTQAGYLALEEYSLELLARGYAAYKRSENGVATFYLNKAEQLSPTSALLLLKSFGLKTALGKSNDLQEFIRICREIWHSPVLIVNLLVDSVYVVLMAVTIALYFVYVLLFASSIATLLRRCSRYFWHSCRGIFTPLFCLALLCVPTYFGLMWSVFVWGLALCLLVPEKKWLCFYSGILLGLWAVLVPIRENVSLWLEDQGVHAMLTAYSGNYSEWDKAMLASLVARRAQDPLAHYSYGQLLRRLGDLNGAQQQFEQAEELMGIQPWTLGQKALLSYLNGDYRASDALFAEAEQLGSSSPELLYNYSKVRYQLMDTETGRQLFSRAHELNPALLLELNKREGKLGVDNPLTFAEMNLPLYYLWNSARISNDGADSKADKVIAGMMPGAAPLPLAFMASMLIVLFLLRGMPKQKTKLETIYPDYIHPQWLRGLLRLIPGGSLVLSGRPSFCFLFLALLSIALMPLLGWPQDMAQFMENFPGYHMYYIPFVALVMLGSTAFGLFLAEERK